MTVKIDQDTIRKIVELTLRCSTSADNQQPWSFHWDSETLTVREAFQGLKHADPGRFLNTLNLGTMAETIDIVTSMSSIRLKPEFSYSPEPSNLGMQVTFTESSRKPDELVEAVEKRWCDRRSFKSGAIKDSDIKALHSDLHDGVKLYFSSEVEEMNLSDGMIWAKLFMTERVLKGEMYEWLRFSKREAERTRDGMYWVTFKDTWMSARLLQLGMSPSLFVQFCVRPTVITALRAVDFLKRRFSVPKVLVPGGDETLGCITVKKTNPRNIIEAGRSVIRVWMRLNLMGYSYQPKLTYPLIFSYIRPEAEQGPGLAGSLVHRSKINECLDICRETFNFDKDETAVWIFRAGLPIGPRHYTTLRKHTDEVLSFS